MNVLQTMQASHPARRKIKQISHRALRAKYSQFKFICEKIGAASNAEWPAIMFCTADDHESADDFFILRGRHAELWKFVAQQLLRAFHPVSEQAGALLDARVERVNKRAISARAGHNQKISTRIIRRVWIC